VMSCDEWPAAVRLRPSQRSDSSSPDCSYKGPSPGQSVEPDTGLEWQPKTHLHVTHGGAHATMTHGDSAAIDENFSVNVNGGAGAHTVSLLPSNIHVP
jgi:hypothetical protein